MAVTDHDTTAAVADVRAQALAAGIEAVPGIEITSIESGRDVHILGYFIDPEAGPLQTFLAAQRRNRVTRVEAIAARLHELGLPVDIRKILDEVGDSTRTVGRPHVARAMIDAGYVAGITEAFDKWLGRHAPAFVPRSGASPEDVIETIHAARGLASLAHPWRTGIDARIPALRAAGLDAIEAFHSDHDPAQIERYRTMAQELRCLVTGGSDFHGDPARDLRPGAATLPVADWERLSAAGRARHD